MRTVPMQKYKKINTVSRLSVLVILSVIMLVLSSQASLARPSFDIPEIELPEIDGSEKSAEQILLESQLTELQTRDLEISQNLVDLELSLATASVNVSEKKTELETVTELLDQAQAAYDELLKSSLSASSTKNEKQAVVDNLLSNKETLAESLLELQKEAQKHKVDLEQLTLSSQQLTQAFIVAKDQKQALIINVQGERSRFVLLTQVWEQKVGSIIASYKAELDKEADDEAKKVLQRYIGLLDDLLNKYRDVFVQILEVYNVQIIDEQSALVGIQAEYEILGTQIQNQTSGIASSLITAEANIENKTTTISSITAQIVAAVNELSEVNGLSVEANEALSNSQTELNTIAAKETAVKQAYTALKTTEEQLISEISAIKSEKATVSESIVVTLQKIAELIISQQPELTRDEKIEVARAELDNNNYTESGRCQASPDKGMLIACFESNKEDIVRISYQDFLDLGVDLNGVPKESIGVFTADTSVVPMYVNADDLIDESSYLEIVTKGYDSIYTDKRMYQVLINIDEAFQQSVNTSEMVLANEVTLSESTFQLTVDNNNHYSNSAVNDGGWYDPNGFAYLYRQGNANLGFEFTLEDNLIEDKEATINYNYGQSATIRDSLIISAYVNDVQVLENFETEKGYAFVDAQLDVPAGVLQEGVNTLTFEVTKSGNGLRGAIEIDGFTVNYRGSTTGQNGSLNVASAITNGRAQEYYMNGLTGSDAVAYGINSRGAQRYALREDVTVSEEDRLFLTVPNQNKLIARSTLNSVELIKPREYQPLPLAGVEYLIISHADFIDSQAMNDLVAFRSTEYAVQVVDIDRIYAQYSGGAFDAFSVKEYLKELIEGGDLSMVLLVGDDTFDYKNTLETNTKSYVPSMYFTYPKTDPSDSIFVDADNDKLPDAAIGRMPVESVEELANIVEKTIQYENHTYANTAMLITNYTNGRSAQYEEILRRSFPHSNLGYGAFWDINSILLNPEDGVVTEELVSASSDLAIDALNDGVSLTVYTGHNTQQTGHVLFDSHIPLMQNVGKPTVLMSIDSYTGRYTQDAVGESESVKAESLLVAKDVGAAAVFANASSNAFAQYQIDTLKELYDNERLGDAHKKAFLSAVGTGRAFYNLFGDPALRIKAF